MSSCSTSLKFGTKQCRIFYNEIPKNSSWLTLFSSHSVIDSAANIEALYVKWLGYILFYLLSYKFCFLNPIKSIANQSWLRKCWPKYYRTGKALCGGTQYCWYINWSSRSYWSFSRMFVNIGPRLRKPKIHLFLEMLLMYLVNKWRSKTD